MPRSPIRLVAATDKLQHQLTHKPIAAKPSPSRAMPGPRGNPSGQSGNGWVQQEEQS
jgi:hypothetical protein